MRKIIFGIRESILAKAQLDKFISYLAKNGINMEFQIRMIKTEGDQDKSTPIEQLGQDIFTKEIEQALLSGEIGCAVHSLKDVPVEIREGTLLSCFLPRSDERDCLVCRDGVSPGNLKGLRIAAGSPRRQAFLRELEPELHILPLRGNVDTRIKKLENGEFDAMVLAACGLRRIGYGDRISLYFDSNSFVPAAGQGVICAQTRQDDTELNSALKNVSYEDTELAVESERRVLKELGVGCHAPFGVFARLEDDNFIINAKVYIKEKNSCIFSSLRGSKEDIQKITDELICRLKDETKAYVLK